MAQIVTSCAAPGPGAARLRKRPGGTHNVRMVVFREVSQYIVRKQEQKRKIADMTTTRADIETKQTDREQPLEHGPGPH